MPDMPLGSHPNLFVRSILAPVGLAVLALTAVCGVLTHAGAWVIPIGLLLYANAVVLTYFTLVRRTTGVNLAANPTLPLAPQYRVWTERAAQASEALQDLALQADPTVKPLLEPIALRAREMAAKVDGLAVAANAMYRDLLELPVSASTVACLPAGDPGAQMRTQLRQTVAASHEQLVAAAESILAGMDGVRAQAMRAAMAGLTSGDGALGQATQKLDEMRATADAVEEVVARAQGQVAAT